MNRNSRVAINMQGYKLIILMIVILAACDARILYTDDDDVTDFACGCKMNLSPLCAGGNTYGNQCALDCENRRRLLKGLPPLQISCHARCAAKVCQNGGTGYSSPPQWVLDLLKA